MESALGNNSDRLNAINIFPVPDGDTGSNLYHTVAAATRALHEVDQDASAGRALTRDALLADVLQAQLTFLLQRQLTLCRGSKGRITTHRTHL